MPNERNYLDDLPGVSGYAFGKFHLDDLDFADDPLKRKIDFIDDALLAPPNPGADITSGVKTSREVMGERKPQPTDKVGMRPEDYIRKRPAASHEHASPAPQVKKESAPARYEYEEVKTAKAPVRSPEKNRTRPSGDRLEEAYARYKEKKQSEEAGRQAGNVRTAAPFGAAARAGTALGGSPTSYDRARAAFGRTKTAARGRRSLTIGVFVIMAIVISAVMEIFSNLSGSVPSITPEPSGFAGQTGGYIAEEDDDFEGRWMAAQEFFAFICENPAEAESVVGTDLYSIGIDEGMLAYLTEEAHSVTSEEDCSVYEVEIGDYDIDYYRYDEYGWLRFWSGNYEDVADIAFYYDDMVIQVVDVNGERVAALE